MLEIAGCFMQQIHISSFNPTPLHTRATKYQLKGSVHVLINNRPDIILNSGSLVAKENLLYI